MTLTRTILGIVDIVAINLCTSYVLLCILQLMQVVSYTNYVVWYLISLRDTFIMHLLSLRDCFYRLGANATWEASVNSGD
jgi:hypothetical protein